MNRRLLVVSVFALLIISGLAKAQEPMDLTKSLVCMEIDDIDFDGVLNKDDRCWDGNDKVDTDLDRVADECDLCPSLANYEENVEKNSKEIQETTTEFFRFGPPTFTRFYRVPLGLKGESCKLGLRVIPQIQVLLDNYNRIFSFFR